MNGLILCEGQESYSKFSTLFQKIDQLANNYNWLISNAVCTPQKTDIYRLLNNAFFWISGKKLKQLLYEDDFQWIWGVLSGFPKNITLDEVLGYQLPYCDGYVGFWRTPLTIQHPLAEVELVAWDSSCSLFISNNKLIIDSISLLYPQSIDLAQYNNR